MICTDAHKQSDLQFTPLGVGVARRVWLTRRDVLNTLSAARLREAIKGK